ncbi:hypothetical protein BU26DRAFT_34651 [Trematosphaeria pertusa]|uniref:Uncharacterized protein n=1 Tax=Trematosphaeria pertusa TaxID=390896 RepID=A0A6A6J4A6_9PLEO|nr:uncharacterized protein BU26DRAFT_34651 [Trematosphaeria pertusa]KAF2257052.1 hypothetical protein BU26DRAFT_34651 [Trematosphaeria pertusa]
MSKAIERPKTPPPLEHRHAQLPTPPLTGGFAKAVNFSISRRLARTEGSEETLVDFFQIRDDCYGVAVSDDSSARSSSPSGVELSSASTTVTVLEKHDPFPSFAIANDAPCTSEPFPFLKLPLSVRNRVYEFLLVIPALICMRQKHTSYHNDKGAYLSAEQRELLPGIAYALPQLTVGGYKFRFTRFHHTNTCILGVSKEVHAEAKAVLYGLNDFEIGCPNMETSPAANFKVPLFPRNCQRLVRKLHIRVRACYPLQWLLNGGYAELKDAYRALETLTLILEVQDAKKGFGRRWTKKEGEKWVVYVKRLNSALAVEFFGSAGKIKNVPLWMDLRVLFDGEKYHDTSELERGSTGGGGLSNDSAEENAKRLALKRGLVEAFELFKRGSH